MKISILFLYLSLILTLYGYGQNKQKYIIEGLLPDNSLDGLYITLSRATLIFEEEVIIDSIKVKKNKFYYKGITEKEPFLASLTAPTRKLGFLIIEPGKINVTVSSPFLMAQATGTPLNEEHNKEILLPMRAFEEADTLTEKRIKALRKGIWTEDNELNYQQTLPLELFRNLLEKRWTFIENHLQYPEIIVFYLYFYYSNKQPGIEKVLSQLPAYTIKRLQQEKEKQTITEDDKKNMPNFKLIENIPESIEVGQPFTDFTGITPDGKQISLSEVVKNNKLVLIDFWASWCGPCMQEMHLLAEIYKQYQDKGLQIIGISSDRNHQQWTAAIQKKNMAWLQIRSIEEDYIQDIYSIKFLPSTILINHDGIIIARKLRGEELLQKIKEILN